METTSELLKFGCVTHDGNVRDHNEDNYVADVELGLWLVADGMGGHNFGEVASSIASEVVQASVRKNKSLPDAIQNAHKAIVQSGKEGKGSPGMGSTIVAIKVQGVGYEIAWVGDSRAYLWDGNHLRQVSKDHSFVQQLLDSGAITKEQALHHPKKNLIYQCLGSLESKSVNVPLIAGEFLSNHKILLCSDGLNDEVTDAEISRILSEDKPEQTLVEHLVDAALSNGGNDNVTVVLVSAPDTAPEKYKAGDTQPFKTQAFKIKTQPPENVFWKTVGTILIFTLAISWIYYYLQ